MHILAKLGLQVVVGFYQKNPWAILPTIVMGALPVILIVSMTLGLIGGLVKPVVANDSVKCESSTAAIDSLFKDSNNISYSAQRQALYGKDCIQNADSTGSLSFYDYTGWFNITTELKGLIGKPYDQGKIDSILQEVLDATGVNMPGKGASQALKDQVKGEFNQIVNENKGKSSVWKALNDWAQQYLSQSLGSSGIGDKIVTIAETRAGLPYSNNLTSYNASGKCYNSNDGVCGFNCAALASWAWGEALGATAGQHTLGAQPYGIQSSTQLYNYILSNKLGHVVPQSQAQPGDFIFTMSSNATFGGSWDHTSIYAGVKSFRGQTTPMYIEASNPEDGISVRSGWFANYDHVVMRLAASDASAADSSSTSPNGQGDTTAHNKNAAVAQAYAKSLMASQYGWGDSQFSCLVQLWNGESGWQWNALNASSDGNPAANPSTDAYGIAQAWPGSKMAAAGSDWRTNYMTQVKWGLQYLKNTSYGTPCKAYNTWLSRSPHWY